MAEVAGETLEQGSQPSQSSTPTPPTPQSSRPSSSGKKPSSKAANAAKDRAVLTPTTARGTGQLSGVQIMFAVILAIGLLLAINFSNRITQGQPLLNAYDKVQAEIYELQTEQANLQAERDFVQSSAYVEQWARERGKMVRPGEKLVIPVPVSNATTPTPTPSESEIMQQFDSGVPEPENWHLWWALFFDSSPPQLATP